MGQTANIQLNTISVSDDMTVREFFQLLAGNEGSNMVILDTKIGELTASVANLSEEIFGEGGYAARIAANEAAIKAIQDQSETV